MCVSFSLRNPSIYLFYVIFWFINKPIYRLFLLQTHRQYRVLLRAAEVELVPVQAVGVHTQRQAGGDEGNLRQGDNRSRRHGTCRNVYTCMHKINGGGVNGDEKKLKCKSRWEGESMAVSKTLLLFQCYYLKVVKK